MTARKLSGVARKTKLRLERPPLHPCRGQRGRSRICACTRDRPTRGRSARSIVSALSHILLVRCSGRTEKTLPILQRLPMPVLQQRARACGGQRMVRQGGRRSVPSIRCSDPTQFQHKVGRNRPANAGGPPGGPPKLQPPLARAPVAGGETVIK